MILPNRFPVIHCVESRNLVDSHGWHLQHPGDFVHNADTGEAMLTLPQVKKGHNRRLLVLWRVTLEDFVHESEVLGGEFEGKGGVVGWFISMLHWQQHLSAIAPL